MHNNTPHRRHESCATTHNSLCAFYLCTVYFRSFLHVCDVDNNAHIMNQSSVLSTFFAFWVFFLMMTTCSCDCRLFSTADKTAFNSWQHDPVKYLSWWLCWAVISSRWLILQIPFDRPREPLSKLKTVEHLFRWNKTIHHGHGIPVIGLRNIHIKTSD